MHRIERERERIVQHVRNRVPNVLSIYAFGSQIQGTATPESDLDLAVLVAGYADPLLLFDLAGELSDWVSCPVDLLDFRAASTVMQYQILMTGQRWWVLDIQADLFEAAVLTEKLLLEEARAEIMADIRQRGTVYGG